MKSKIWKCVALVLALMCILTFPIGVSATAQGTNGDEMQVATPEKLEIHLGQEWAGTTFELTTDYGKYPDPIPVGEDGVLRLEIGGSSSYVLSCLGPEMEAPAPGETSPSENAPSESTLAEDATVSKDELEDIEDVTPTEPTEEDGKVAGIPVSHIIMFGGGLLVAVGALIGIHYYQRKRESSGSASNDENDEI